MRQPIINWLKTLPRDEIVMYVDAWDSFFTDSLVNIEAVFRAFDVPIVHAAELSLFPGENLGEYPPAPTRWRYINGGGFIGYAGSILDMYTDAAFWPECCTCNQAAYHHWFIRHQDVVAVDYYCRLWCCLYKVDVPAEVCCATLPSGVRRITNLVTDTLPCVIHGNSGLKALAAQLWTEMRQEG